MYPLLSWIRRSIEGYILKGPKNSPKVNEIILVLRALYGLKEVPALLFDELRRELVKLELKPVQGFTCLYTNSWLILSVNVDDIAVAFHKSNTNLHVTFEKKFGKPLQH